MKNKRKGLSEGRGAYERELGVRCCRCYLLMSGAQLIQGQGMIWQRAEQIEKFVTEKGKKRKERGGSWKSYAG